MKSRVKRIALFIIVDKNRQRGTKVKHLVDMKSAGDPIRNVTNFRKRYLKGYYAGVPKASLLEGAAHCHRGVFPDKGE